MGQPASAPSDADAKYSAMIEKRVGEILAVLKLDDPAKQSKVHDILIAQYGALRDWQNANEAKLKDKSTTPEQKQEILATRKPLHDQFLSQLSEQLTPEQIEQVKDKMTYNKVQVTYNAYLQQLQGKLNDEQKAKILEFLKAAREDAIDGVSAEEKTAIFGKYKGKINNYLATQGISMKQK